MQFIAPSVIALTSICASMVSMVGESISVSKKSLSCPFQLSDITMLQNSDCMKSLWLRYSCLLFSLFPGSVSRLSIAVSATKFSSVVLMFSFETVRVAAFCAISVKKASVRLR